MKISALKKIFRRSRQAESGFTLIELLVASMLMVGVTTIAANFWKTLSLSMKDMQARSSTAEQMRFTIENIAGDFGPAVGATIFDIEHLLICKDSGITPNGTADWEEPDIIVEYYIVDKQLRRFDQSANTEIVIADNVSLFEVEEVDETSIGIIVELERSDIIRKAKFTWSRP